MKSSDEQTLLFYANESAAYAARSEAIGISKSLNALLTILPSGAEVLDLGCGTGRDTLAIRDAGFSVTAIDGSAEMAREAEKRVGLPVRVLLFEDLDYENQFDGIWACASLLHVPRAGLADVLARVHRALKPGGTVVASFKSGGAEGRDSLGRYYNYLNRDEAEALFLAAGRWAKLELKTGSGTGYDGTETGWIEVRGRKSTDDEPAVAALD
ncbi:MAG: class I SAM-dependent methyltransferase [Micropepsaceae bacterium]